jgi:hypothetical protein
MSNENSWPQHPHEPESGGNALYAAGFCLLEKASRILRRIEDGRRFRARRQRVILLFRHVRCGKKGNSLSQHGDGNQGREPLNGIVVACSGSIIRQSRDAFDPSDGGGCRKSRATACAVACRVYLSDRREMAMFCSGSDFLTSMQWNARPEAILGASAGRVRAGARTLRVRK